MNLYLHKLEKGRQLGISKPITIDGKKVWISVAVQKWQGKYKVYISEILESKMVAEEYMKEIIRSFDAFEKCSGFIEQNSIIKIEELGPLKGQKIFNPEFD